MNRICRSRRRATVQKPSCSEGHSFRTLKTNSGHQTADHEEPPIVDSAEMNGHGSPNRHPLFHMFQNHVNQYAEQSMNAFVTLSVGPRSYISVDFSQNVLP